MQLGKREQLQEGRPGTYLDPLVTARCLVRRGGLLECRGLLK